MRPLTALLAAGGAVFRRVDAGILAPGCALAPGPGAVAIAAGELHVVQSCGVPGFTLQHWRREVTGWNPDRGGLGAVVLPDSDGAALTAAGGRLYAAAHTLAGPGGIASELLVARSDDGGRAWRMSWVNPPADLERARDDGPNVFSPVAVDPLDPDHVGIAWVAESRADLAQLHAADTIDDHEYDTKLYFGESRDGGGTWSVRELADRFRLRLLAGHEDYDDLGNWAPSVAFGRDGSAYVAFAEQAAGADGARVKLLRGRGGSWTGPVGVSGTRSAFSPRVVALPGRRVAVAWYASEQAAQDPAARWHVALAAGRWRRRPALEETALTGTVHTGPLCPIGPDCSDAFKWLGAAYARGRLIVAHAADHPAGMERRVVTGRIGDLQAPARRSR